MNRNFPLTGPQIYTTKQVAQMFKISTARVRRIARDRNIRPVISTGRSHIWTASQVELMRPGAVGRPKRSD